MKYWQNPAHPRGVLYVNEKFSMIDNYLLILNAGYDREKANIELPIEEFLSIIKGIESSYSSELAQDVAEKITEIKQDHEKELAYMTVEEWIQDEKDEARAEGRAEGFSAGREAGLSDGLSKGLEQGRAEGLNDALRILGISREEFEKIKNSN